ncbi:MAG: amino acid ABC transporter permease [Tissierellaceae bacterium]
MSLEIVKDILIKYWPMFLRGAGITLFLAVVGTTVGFIIGLVIGVIRTIPLPEIGPKRVFLKIVNGILAAYIEFFRGTPMMVQAMFFFYGVAGVFGVQLNKLFAGTFIISINTGAYMAEIVRGGIVSVDPGQYEAAEALGMNHYQTMINVMLPQVIRNILPATGNEFVVNIKDSSVLNVISVTELFFQTRSVSGSTFRFAEAYFITCMIYFVMTFTVTKILRSIEGKMDGPKNYNIIGNQMQVERPEDLVRKQDDHWHGN